MKLTAKSFTTVCLRLFSISVTSVSYSSLVEAAASIAGKLHISLQKVSSKLDFSASGSQRGSLSGISTTVGRGVVMG